MSYEESPTPFTDKLTQDLYEAFSQPLPTFPTDTEFQMPSPEEREERKAAARIKEQIVQQQAQDRYQERLRITQIPDIWEVQYQEDLGCEGEQLFTDSYHMNEEQATTRAKKLNDRYAFNPDQYPGAPGFHVWKLEPDQHEPYPIENWHEIEAAVTAHTQDTP